MKSLFLTLLGCIALLNAAAQGWVLQPSNTSFNLNDVHFVDANIGCAVGDSGTILTTTDGGDNWIVQQSGTTNEIHSVHFTNPLTGFAVTSNRLLKTTDGGTNWLIQDTTILGYSPPIFFIGIDTGFVVGDGKILKTIDGGLNWTMDTSANVTTHSFWATNSNTFYLGMENFSILKSTNGGMNWAQISPFSTYGDYESIFFTDQNTGYFVGGGWAQGFTNSAFRKTQDGGATWSYPLGNINKWLTCIFFTDGLTGYMTAQDGSILKTTTAWNNWSTLNSTVSSSLNSIFFADSFTGYTVGNGGIILKTTSTGVGLDEKTLEEKLIIYPNPTSDQITISLGNSVIHSIKILDQSGKITMTVDPSITCIHVEDLSRGIYFIQIVTDEGSSIKKFVKDE